MIDNKKIVIVLPAYNAALTLKKTYEEIPFEIVDEVILVDDDSSDKTIEIGHELGISHIIKHDKNRGYGGNQKTCYNKALGNRGRYHHYAASRLPVHTKAYTINGISYCQQRLPGCSWLAYIGQRSIAWRHAIVQIHS
jgi:cellulose synthase/poly-beta-1,6-N-acetylglucosamine synthase-like glycosyltransferase